jgi:hypothetical protein
VARVVHPPSDTGRTPAIVIGENMSMLKAAFRRAAIRRFHFLEEEFGCHPLGVDDAGARAVTVTYVNSTTGVVASFEPLECQVLVYLVQLVDGQVPPYLTAPTRYCLLDSLLATSCIPLPAASQPPVPPTPTGVEAAVAANAAALEHYGADVLRGDFSVFDDVQSWIRRHAPPAIGPAVGASTHG